MAIIKCKMCGGEIELIADKTFGTCEFCGSVMTLPKVDDEQRAAAFNRGNHFRRIGEFDKALAVYERIVREDNTDAEAHWCCAICRFGIEYVEDPATYEYLPTCHRVSFDSFLEDVDYLAAVEYSDGITKRQYQKEGSKIAEVQRGILATSQNEEPFDVFICYKESDENGERTRDSLMAQDVYYQLTEKGYRVFFSRITLEDMAGRQYEPYIFAALNSAKVMIVIGTKSEYMSAVWVKNEWSRFLAMMKKDNSKLLLPCYRDMDPYDMPEQLSVLQSYDMSKIGFIQDLTRGIKKVLDSEKMSDSVKLTGVQLESVTLTAPLLKRAFMFLEDGDWKSANEYCEKILDIDPENASAYLGKLLSELEVKNQESLKDQTKPFDNRNNYQKVIRFADEKLKTELAGYIEHINLRNEKARLDNIYIRAKNVMSMANTESDYKEAAQLFESICDYQDSTVLAKECYEKAENEKQTAAREIQRSNLLFAEYRTAIENEKEIVVLESEIVSLREKYVDLSKDYEVLLQKKEDLVLVKNEREKVEESKLILIKQEKIYQEELHKLENEIANLGFFAGKKKKEIQDRINAISEENIVLHNKINQLDYKLFNMDNRIKDRSIEILRYPSLEYLYKEIEGTKKAIDSMLQQKEALKIVIEAKSSQTIRDELSAFEVGKELLFKFDFLKNNNIVEGAYITFGEYEQDNNTSNGKEAIEWLVIEVKDSKALLISRFAIECMEYHTGDFEEATWETCTLRKWLNGDFYNSAFTTVEKKMISLVTINSKIDSKSNYDYDYNYETKDHVFLLGKSELRQHFYDSDGNELLGKMLSGKMQCIPTDYAVANGAYKRNGCCEWWTRDWLKDLHMTRIRIVTYYGGVPIRGHADDKKGVRPVLWIDMNI